MIRVYLYRLKHFSGLAPCFDDDLFSLAVCKPVIRRKVAELFFSSDYSEDKDEIWILGIVGSYLANRDKSFRKWNDQIYFMAKVTDVKSFIDYFNDHNMRKDNLYIIVSHVTSLSSSDCYFLHRKGVKAHDKQEEWERDFDIKSSNKTKYVLLSDDFYFLSPDEGDILKNFFIQKEKWPLWQGHRVWSGDDKEVISVINQTINNLTNPTKQPGAIEKSGCCKGKC